MTHPEWLNVLRQCGRACTDKSELCEQHTRKAAPHGKIGEVMSHLTMMSSANEHHQATPANAQRRIRQAYLYHSGSANPSGTPQSSEQSCTRCLPNDELHTCRNEASNAVTEMQYPRAHPHRHQPCCLSRRLCPSSSSSCSQTASSHATGLGPSAAENIADQHTALTPTYTHRRTRLP